MTIATKAKRPRDLPKSLPADAGIVLVCPVCRGEWPKPIPGPGRQVCAGCGFEMGLAAGFPDFRTAADRYLSRNQETRKAARLAEHEAAETLEGLARRYYRMTADVSPARERRFVRHILDAQARGHALLARVPGAGAILDVGCGTGGFVAAAAAAGRQVVGIDIASRWLVVCRKRVESAKRTGLKGQPTRHSRSDPPGPGLITACVEALPFADGTFAAVVADSLLEHLENPLQAMAEMIRVLKPGGTLVIWFPNRRWIGPDPHIGLIGLPLLPQKLARRYVAARRGPVYWPRCGTGKEWAALALAVDRGLEAHIRAADLNAWPADDRGSRARSARLLGRLAKLPVSADILKRFGPIGEIVIRKPVVPIAEVGDDSPDARPGMPR